MIPVKLNFDVDFTFRFLALASSSSSWNVYPELRAFFRILLHRLYRYRIKGWLSLSRTLLISLEVEDSMCREESRSNTPVIRDESSITQSIIFLPGTQSSDCTGSLNNSIIFDFSCDAQAVTMKHPDISTTSDITTTGSHGKISQPQINMALGFFPYPPDTRSS